MDAIDWLKKYWQGKQVIVISNAFINDETNDSLSKGRVTDITTYKSINGDSINIPVVQFENTTESSPCYSVVMIYDALLWQALKKLTPNERWILATHFAMRFNK